MLFLYVIINYYECVIEIICLLGNLNCLIFCFLIFESVGAETAQLEIRFGFLRLAGDAVEYLYSLGVSGRCSVHEGRPKQREGVASRERIHIPPLEQEKHLQYCFFRGYVSSQEDK